MPHPPIGPAATEDARSTAKDDEDRTIKLALGILATRFNRRHVFAYGTESIKDFLRLQAQGLMHEVFAVMYLDIQGRLIEYERMFRGSLARACVYPREIVKQALAVHAESVILHHNHPGGTCRPSPDDVALTRCLRAALALVDIRVVDHIITTEELAFSMAEAGLMS